MITNDNYTWTCRTMKNVLTKGYMDNSDIMISYLPLSHVAGKLIRDGIPTENKYPSSSNCKKFFHYTAQMLDMHMPMFEGYQIYFAQPDALKGSLAATLREVRPTTFFGVPRVGEKMCEKFSGVRKIDHRLEKDAINLGQSTNATALGRQAVRRSSIGVHILFSRAPSHSQGSRGVGLRPLLRVLQWRGPDGGSCSEILCIHRHSNL